MVGALSARACVTLIIDGKRIIKSGVTGINLISAWVEDVKK